MSKINKIRIIGNVKILESDNEKVVIKKKKKDLSTLFDYLSQRDFNGFPIIIEENKEEIRYKYYSVNYLNPSNDEDLIKTISDLHYKTTYYKDVSRKKYKDIYNTLMENVDYLKEYYDNLIRTIDLKTYMSPSDYLIARNYSIISSLLLYIEKELNSWYNLVKDKTKERVCIVHNNLKRDNFIDSEGGILTGWDNYLVDTRVLDIYKLYKNEYKNLDFKNLFTIYNEKYPLSKEEIKLFNVMVSMIKKIETEGKELERIKEIKEMIDYIYRTNDLVSTIFK